MKNNLSQKNIPNGWQRLKLGDCLVVKHGKPQKEVEVSGGKYPILATGGVIGRTNTALYSKPSVLIGRKGTIDKPSYMDTPFWTVDTLFYTQIKDGFSPKYLYFKFQTINWKLYNEGSGLPSLSASTISVIKTIIPSLPEQKRIVAVLEIWDRAIEKLIRKIEVKKNIKTGLMQQLLTGKKRLSGFKGEWEVKKLGDLCDIGTGKKNNQDKTGDGAYPFFVRSPVVERINSYSYDGEAILIPGEGNIGKIFHYINGKFDFHQRVYKISDFKEGVFGKYIHYFLVKNFSKATKSDSVKATVDSLRLPTFTNFRVNLPSLSEQKIIVAVLDSMSMEIEKLQQKLSLLQDQKKYLLNNLITGAIRTPEKMKIKA